MSVEEYSVPLEAMKVFQEGIINNPLHQKLREELKSVSHLVQYKGSDFPLVPVNWRFCESISALKGLEASMINIFNQKKYSVEPQGVLINTDHANLLYMSEQLWSIDTSGGELNPTNISDPLKRQKFHRLFPNQRFHNQSNPVYQAACTNIYKTKDGRFFHLHGSLNSEPMQKMLNLPLSVSTTDRSACYKIYADAVGQLTSNEIQQLVTDVYGQAGTICWSIEEYKNSIHGQANAHVGLWDIHYIPNVSQKPSWWISIGQTSAKHPLAGLKVLDLTRIIAAPTTSRLLAGYGASVMRIISPNIDDVVEYAPDLAWGKWNAFVDLKTEAGKQILRELIMEADVFLIGYRPQVLDKYGFSRENILDMTKDRPTGLIYAQENCYGWNGPWSHRTGWQAISSANCGIALEFARAMGHNEPVIPGFSTADYGAGMAGFCGILDALIQRAEKGGSYVVDIALHYYSQWLIDSVGVYPEEIWQALWFKHGQMIFHSEDNMQTVVSAFMNSLREHHTDLFTNPAYYIVKYNNVLKENFRFVKDCIQWTPGSVDFDYRISARGNGVDQPRWPKDLSVEIVTTTN